MEDGWDISSQKEPHISGGYCVGLLINKEWQIDSADVTYVVAESLPSMIYSIP